MTHTFTTSHGNILLREATPADAAVFRELRLGALQDSPIAFSADYQKNLNEPLESWEDRLTMHPDEATIFFAEHKRSSPVDNNTLIGMTGIFRGGSPKTRHAATVWGVYVQPEWRGLHIAEELINACLRWARARRIVVARLGVAATNTSAVHCYERCGFRTYATEQRALHYEGKYYDFYMMTQDLDDLHVVEENHADGS